MGDPDDGRARIVTHRRPHLDEVVAIWLLKTFDPDFRNASIEFIPYFGKVPNGAQVVTVGIGGGKYDEHHMMTDHTSATALVAKDLRARGLLPGQHRPQTIDWLVGYTDEIDRGADIQDEHRHPFTLPGIIRSHIERTGSDADAIRLGLELVDDIVNELDAKARFLDDWSRRIEFDSPWGRGVGLESDYPFSETYAYAHGFAIRVQKHRSETISSIKLDPERAGDLSGIYHRLINLEPQSWYLHQAKKMVISNIASDAGRPPSRLSLKELISNVNS